ncbi:hypothetical protein FDA94_31500 [Herbidospora galbida]|uniref:Uncharacterized protein n=1 Tax=Herbidospora galbida TaxID=2575442 RepID=A0A4V6XBB1_9ACTN|nr:hypothetical protein [Herbidospora galbida]TKK84053.1 hypothetical protein FDA94_31500 [Herbidospora galbida]
MRIMPSGCGGRARRRPVLVFGPPLAVALYAVINLVAIRLAADPVNPTYYSGPTWEAAELDWLDRRARDTVGLLGAWLLLLAPIAVATAVLGRGPRQGPTAAVSVLYLSLLVLLTWAHPLSVAANPDDQSGYILQNRSWHPVALIMLCLAAVVAQVVGLLRATTGRGRRPRPASGRSNGPRPPRPGG